jgi:hypothetical protein
METRTAIEGFPLHTLEAPATTKEGEPGGLADPHILDHLHYSHYDMANRIGMMVRNNAERPWRPPSPEKIVLDEDMADAAGVEACARDTIAEAADGGARPHAEQGDGMDIDTHTCTGHVPATAQTRCSMRCRCAKRPDRGPCQ